MSDLNQVTQELLAAIEEANKSAVDFLKALENEDVKQSQDDGSENKK